MTLTENYHNWPMRELSWGKAVRRTITVVWHSEQPELYSIVVGAVQDRGEERYWRNETIVEKEALEVIRRNLLGYLEKGQLLADSWDADDLEFATRVSRTSGPRLVLTQVASWALVALLYGAPLALLVYLLFRIRSCAGG